MGGASSVFKSIDTSCVQPATDAFVPGRRKPAKERRERLVELCSRGPECYPEVLEQLADILPFPGKDTCELVGKLLAMAGRALGNRANLTALSERMMAFLQLLATYATTQTRTKYKATVEKFTGLLEAAIAYAQPYMDTRCVALMLLPGSGDEDDYMQLASDLGALAEELAGSLACDATARLQLVHRELELVGAAKELLLRWPAYKDAGSGARALAEQLGGLQALLADESKLLQVVAKLDPPDEAGLAAIKADIRAVSCFVAKALQAQDRSSRYVSSITTVSTTATTASTTNPSRKQPHEYIRQPDLRRLWARHYPGAWDCPWDSFWATFPQLLKDHPSHLLPSDAVSRLCDLLEEPASRKDLRRSLPPGDRAAALSVVQLRLAFTDDELLAQVEERLVRYQALPGTSSLSDTVPLQLPPLPPGTLLREKEVQRVLQLLGSRGAVNIVAAAGMGASTVAGQVAWRMVECGSLSRGAVRVDVGDMGEWTRSVDLLACFAAALGVPELLSYHQEAARHVPAIVAAVQALLAARAFEMPPGATTVSSVGGGGPAAEALEAAAEASAAPPQTPAAAGGPPSLLLWVDNVDEALLRSEASTVLSEVLSAVRSDALGVRLLVTSTAPLLPASSAAIVGATSAAPSRTLPLPILPEFRLGPLRRPEAILLIRSVAKDLSEREAAAVTESLGASPLALTLGSKALVAGLALEEIADPPPPSCRSSLDHLPGSPPDQPVATIRRVLEALAPAHQEAVSQLAVFRSTFNDEAAAAVLGQELYRARALLHVLRRRGVLQQGQLGVAEGYQLHPLVRQQAAQLQPQLRSKAEERLAVHMFTVVREWSAVAQDPAAAAGGAARLLLNSNLGNLRQLFEMVLEPGGPAVKTLMASSSSGSSEAGPGGGSGSISPPAESLAGDLAACMLAYGRVEEARHWQREALMEVLLPGIDYTAAAARRLGALMSPPGREAAVLTCQVLGAAEAAIINKKNLQELGHRCAALLHILAVCEATLQQAEVSQAIAEYKTVMEAGLEYCGTYSDRSSLPLLLSPAARHEYPELVQLAGRLAKLERAWWRLAEAGSEARARVRQLGPAVERAVKEARGVVLGRPQFEDVGAAARAVAKRLGGLDAVLKDASKQYGGGKALQQVVAALGAPEDVAAEYIHAMKSEAASQMASEVEPAGAITSQPHQPTFCSPRSWLFDAMRHGNKRAVASLLRAGIMVESCTKKGYTPLHLACLHGDREVVERLIKCGAAVNAQNKHGYTPLHLASSHGYAEVVKVLLATGAVVDIKSKDDVRCSPLHMAAERGHAEVVRLLLRAGADANALSAEGNGATPLHKACDGGFPEVVGLLLAAGADPNTTNGKDSSTPLHCASQKGHVEVVRLLLQAGADANAINEGGVSPLRLASIGGEAAVVKLLLFAGAAVNAADRHGLSSLHVASNEGHPEVVGLLLASGADINAKSSNDDSFTPLHLASRQGQAEVVRLLLNAGADVNAQAMEGYGGTPLHIACEGGHTEVVGLLLAAGAKVDVRDKLGSTPLHGASQCGHAEVATLLLRSGADVNAVNNSEDGRAPLHVAINGGQSAVVEVLLAAGADANAADARGDTPLALAIGSRQTRILDILLHGGADVSARNMRGSTALHAAVAVENAVDRSRMVGALLKAGAFMAAWNMDGETPLDVARRLKHDDAIALLEKRARAPSGTKFR